MSATCKLSSKLPADAETNGLDAKAHRLIERPEDLLVCLAWVDASKVEIDTDSGSEVPTARIRRIEPLGELHEIPDSIKELVQQAVQKRLGRKAIPFESGSVEEGHDPDQTTIDEA